jgi:hypothetical protein
MKLRKKEEWWQTIFFKKKDRFLKSRRQITFDRSSDKSWLRATVLVFGRSKQHNCKFTHKDQKGHSQWMSNQKRNHLKITIASIIVAPPISYITKISGPDQPACLHKMEA